MDSNADFKEIMSQYATSVTVVTTRNDDDIAGLTVSSFCSVSLDPPLILVCIETDARSNEILQQQNHFTVNILQDNQEEVSQRFAEPGLDIDKRLQNINYSLPDKSGPILTDSLAWMICRQYDTHPAGDHRIYVGEVIEGQPENEGNPLLYYDGEYGSFES